MSTELPSFVRATRDAEAFVTAELGLEPLRISPRLREAEAVWKGQRVALRACAYRGRTVAYARFVTLHGGTLAIGNIFGVSSPLYPFATLGADLVDIGAETAVAVADLSPVTADATDRAQQLQAVARAALSAQRDGRGDFIPGGELPPWCAPWFSPHALFVRVERAHAARLAGAVRPYLHTWVQMVTRQQAHPETTGVVLETQRAYARAHREHDRGLTLLGKIFGAEFAADFISTVLFPDVYPDP